MSEWVALTTSCPDTPCGPGRGTTPECIDLTTDVMAYCYDHAGHHIAKMRIGAVGVVQEAYYDDGVLLTTEELCAIPPVADLLEALDEAAWLLPAGSTALAMAEAAIAKARGEHA